MKLYIFVWGLLQVKRLVLSESYNLSNFIPADYDKLIPPKHNENEAVKVNLSLYVIQIRSVDETDMNFKMDVLLRQVWKDHRLNFPPNMGSRKVVLDPKWGTDIWTPDVWFKNALDTKLQEWVVPSVFYWLEAGTLRFSGRVTLELSCDMDMHKYPHDTQDCGIEIMSLMNPSIDLILKWREDRPIRVSKIMRLPQFDVDGVKLTECDTILNGELYSCIRASFSLIRRGGYFLINTYIPTVLIVMMSMLTFWIPPEAVPARITLGVTSLLTIITKQYQSSMPNVSYVVALNIWLSSCVGFVFLSLVEYAVVITLSKKANKTDRVTVTPVQKSNEVNSVRKSLKSAWQAKTLSYIEKLSADGVDLFSRILFPILFIIFCIIYSSKYNS